MKTPQIRAQLLTKKPMDMIIHDEKQEKDENGQLVTVISPPYPDGNINYSTIPAWAVCIEHPHKHYEVHINRPYAKKVFASTPLSKNIPYFALETGLGLHEVGHVDNGTCNLDIPMKDDAVLMYILNTLADTRDENWMAYRVPGYSPFIQVALSMVRYVYPTRSEQGGVFEMLHALFHLVRFGKILPDADMRFLSFALPQILSATAISSSPENMLDASLALYAYVMQSQTSEEGDQSQEWKDATGNAQAIGRMVAIDGQDLQEALDAGVVIAIPTDVAGITNQLANGTPLEKLAGGKLAGFGGHPMHIESDGAFARAVQLEYHDEIARMRREYVQFYEQMLLVPMFEGELSEDPMMQQELYLASFTGDDVPGYELPEPRIPSLEQVLVCDVSDSTSEFEVAYAKAVVIVLSALEGVPGFKTSLIRFNHEAELVKSFSDPMDECSLDPQSSGGTCLDDALDIIRGFSWTETIRLMFVITDGDIRHFDYAASVFRLLEKEQNIITWLIDLREGSCSMTTGGKYDHAFVCSIKDLPAAIAEHVMGYIRGKMYGA